MHVKKTTKIILTADIYGAGVAGEVVDVAPGYARNYLIPRGLAIKATPGAMRQMENLRKAAEIRRAEQHKEYTAVAEKLEGLVLYFPVRAGEQGKLYGSVTTQQIVDGIKSELGYEIDRRRVGDRALRELGEYQIPIRLDATITPQVRVIVHREGEEPVAQEAEEAVEMAEEPVYEAVAEYEAEFDESNEAADEA